MRRALLCALTALFALGSVIPVRSADAKVVMVEFQPATDDDAGLAYLLYSTISEELMSEGNGQVVAGEDVEMYLGSAAGDCHKKRSCLDKLAERFQADVAMMATVARDELRFSVTYAFISTTTGNVLEQGRRDFEAGEERKLTEMILDKIDAAIAAAAEDEWSSEVDDGDSAGSGDPPETAEDDRYDDEPDEYTLDERYDDEPDEYTPDEREPEPEDGDDRSRYSARAFEETSSRKSEEEKEARAKAAEAERLARARDREDRYARTDENGDEPDDRDGRQSRYSRDREDSEERDDRYSRDREDRSDREVSDRERRDRTDRDRVKVRDLGDGEEKDAGGAKEKERKTTSRTPTSSQEERSPATTRRERSKKYPEDSDPADDAPLIDPDLLDTFDSEDDALFAEEGRSGTTRLDQGEASELGVGPAEYRAYANSGLTFDGWTRKRYDHKGKFHLRFAGFYALGGLDMYYSVRVVRDASEVYETYYWQTFGFRSVSGGGTFGLGFGVAPAVDLSAEVSMYFGEQWLLREWRTPDGTESTINSTDEPPRGGAMHLMIAPKTRFYFAPFKPVKPYAGFGFALIFMPPFDVPEEWAPDRPGSFVLGLEPTLGMQFDSPLGVGFFFEVPFTGYVGSDHGVESNLSGEGAYLSEEEKNDPPIPVPRYMLRVQLGIQIRI